MDAAEKSNVEESGQYTENFNATGNSDALQAQATPADPPQTDKENQSPDDKEIAQKEEISNIKNDEEVMPHDGSTTPLKTKSDEPDDLPSSAKPYMHSQMTQNDDLAVLAPQINNVQNHLQTLNKIRIENERDGDFNSAEIQLEQIVQIREQAESSLKTSLKDKHTREEDQIEHQNRDEFEQFTQLWDQKFIVYQHEAIQQMQRLRQKHAVQLQ